jgi:hypothetical protein
LVHHKQVLRLRILPDIEVLTPNVKKMKISIFGQSYRFQEDDNGQSIWDKGRCYGNMLRKMLRTHCVLDGNIMRTWWEHIEKNKGLTPLVPILPKRGPLHASCNLIG